MSSIDEKIRVIRADFDLRQLEIFCKVVELGSVSKAAEAVNLTQSSVSERMGTLEKSIGAKLFDRIGRRNVLTDTGKLLYNHALRHMALKEETIQALEGSQGVKKGDLTIGGSTIPGEYIMPAIIQHFCKKHPRVFVRMKIQDTAQITEGVANGELALGIVGAVTESDELEFTPVWKDELVLITAGDHPWAERKSVTLGELASEPFILRESGSGTRKLLEKNIGKALGGKRIDLNVIGELGSSAAIKSGVVSGMGVSVISKRAVASEVETGRLAALSITGFDQKRSFYLVVDKRRTLLPVGVALVEFIKGSGDANFNSTKPKRR